MMKKKMMFLVNVHTIHETPSANIFHNGYQKQKYNFNTINWFVYLKIHT